MYLAPCLLGFPRFPPQGFSPEGFVALAASGRLLSPLRLGLDRVKPAPNFRSTEPVAFVSASPQRNRVVRSRGKVAHRKRCGFGQRIGVRAGTKLLR